MAVMGGNTELVTLLLDRGASINSFCKGEPILILALANGHTNIATILINRGINISSTNNNGMNALLFSLAEQLDPTITGLLINRGADCNVRYRDLTPLIFAIVGQGSKRPEKDVVTIVSLIIQGRGDVNGKAHSHGATALMFAAQLGYNEVIELLLNSGANINDRDNEGMTALMFAVSGQNKSGISRLLKRGANAGLKDNKGYTALAIAQEAGFRDIVALLTNNGK